MEYIGKFPGLSAHGHSKSGDNEYTRTPANVMTEMGEMQNGIQKVTNDAVAKSDRLHLVETIFDRLKIR